MKTTIKTLAWVLAASAIVPGTAAQVKAAVAAAPGNKVLTSAEAGQLPTLAQQNADVRYKLPTLCTPCALGDKASHKVAVVYGDSHARMCCPPSCRSSPPIASVST